MHDISKDDKNLIIKIPLKARRSNPWDESYHPEMDNIVGVIAGDEIGFAHWIDLNYKGKSDQVTAPFYIYDDDKESFLKLCKELGIETYEYPVCAYCQKVMYGSHTLSEKGNQCFDCKDKEKNPQVCTNCGNRFNNPLADLCGSCFENG